MVGRSGAMNFVLGIFGAVIGGAIGHFAFLWIVGQGFYALVIPGAALGLGFSAGFRRKTTAGAVFCGMAAVGLGLFSEWCFRPFVKDDGFQYFLTNIHHLKPITLIMIAVGGVCAFWTVGNKSRAAGRATSDHQQS